MKKLILIYICFFSLSSCKAQSEKFTLSSEKIERKEEKWFYFAGQEGDKLLIVDIDSLGKNAVFWLYDEYTHEAKKMHDISLQNQKIITVRKVDNMLIMEGYFSVADTFMHIPFWDLPVDRFEHQDIWTQIEGKSQMITSFPYAYIDKNIHSEISIDQKYLIINPYYANIGIHTDIEDNIIIIYDLTEIKKGNIKENIIPCERCYNTYVINDTLIFGKELVTEDRSIEFTYSNIYKAPINNINDTIVIARNMELINITPDGKYILGKTKLYGKELTTIIDVASHRYQYIVGRSYHYKTSFYSYAEQKFAFDFGTHFVYVEFPDAYPYDAMIPYKIEWRTDADDKAFWGNHRLKEHKPLE